MALAPLSAGFQSLPLLPTIRLGPSAADSRVGRPVHALGPLWVSSMTSFVRLGVSPAVASTPMGVSTQKFEALFPLRWSPGLRSPLGPPSVPPGLSMHECGATGSASHHLVGSASCSLACPAP